MIILGVCGGNGVFLHPSRKYLIGNIEPRSLFHTKGDMQWRSNFKTPISKDDKPFRGTHVDIIIGAPDCGHSSVFSYSRAKKLSEPSKNDSLKTYVDCVNAFKPHLFFMENLEKGFERMLLHEFFPGYFYKTIIGSVSIYGNSQVTRKRALLIGCKVEEHLEYFKNPKGVPLFTSGELLKGCKAEDITQGHIREDINNTITLYGGFKDTLKNIRKGWLDNPDMYKWKVEGRNFTTAPGVYINRANQFPKTARKANRQFNHWGLTMSPRELAKIQGVPDTFKIYIGLDPLHSTYWINKGRTSVTKCPPYEMGAWIKRKCKKLWRTEFQ